MVHHALQHRHPGLPGAAVYECHAGVHVGGYRVYGEPHGRRPAAGPRGGRRQPDPAPQGPRALRDPQRGPWQRLHEGKDPGPREYSPSVPYSVNIWMK